MDQDPDRTNWAWYQSNPSDYAQEESNSISCELVDVLILGLGFDEFTSGG